MERAEQELADLGLAVHEALVSELPAVEDIRLARASFLQRFASRNAEAAGRHRRYLARHWRALVLASATAAGAAALLVWMRLPVSFHVGAAPGHAGDLVRAAQDRPTGMKFSDGSSLELTAGGRLRVLATNPKGARVLVEDGSVDVNIAPAKLGKKQWSFEAGSFHVQVAGTRFRLSYQAVEQTFALATQEGRVVVSGPCLERPTVVNAGSHVNLYCGPKEAPAPANLSGLAPGRPSEAAVAPGKVPRENALWRELLLAGRLQEGLRAAERADFNRVCRVATAKELLALSDAARLFGRSSRAIAALHVLRQRFPKSSPAATAAFMLGRVAFEQNHAYAEAATWFATYLREQPNGPLMGDSVGRLMEARLRAGDQSGARSDAEQYLRRFPEGPYASEARGILSK